MVEGSDLHACRDGIHVFSHRGEEVCFSPLARTISLGSTPQSWSQPLLGTQSPQRLKLVAPTAVAPVPESVILLLSRFCNLNCTYCYHNGSLHPHSRRLMSPSVAAAAMDWAFASASQSRGLFVALFGGEPLLNTAGLKAAVRRARVLSDQTGVPVDLKVGTNLTLMTDELAEFLALHEVAVQVSIDGPRRAHDKHRTAHGGRGSYDTVVSKLAILRRYMGWDKVSARATLTTEASAGEVLDHLCELGFREISMVPCDGRWSPLADAEGFRSDLDSVMERYLSATRSRQQLHVHPFRAHLRQLFNYVGANQHSRFFDCGGGVHWFAVSPEGCIYPCDRFAEGSEPTRWTLGTVWDGIDAARTRRFTLEMQKDVTGCKDCWCQPFCDGGCKFERAVSSHQPRCLVHDTFQPVVWQTCLYWYAHLRDQEPGILLRMMNSGPVGSTGTQERFKDHR